MMDLLLHSGSLMLVPPLLTRVRGICSDAVVSILTFFMHATQDFFYHTSPLVAESGALLITHRMSDLA